MSKQLSDTELLELCDRLGISDGRTIMEAAKKAYLSAMIRTGVLIADRLDISITGPTDDDFEEFLIGFCPLHPLQSLPPVMGDMDRHGGWEYIEELVERGSAAAIAAQSPTG